MSEGLSEERLAEIKELFSLIDTDGDGKISLEELAAVAPLTGQGGSLELMQLVMSQYDTNGNGTLEFPEYLAMVARQLNSPHARQYEAQLQLLTGILRDGEFDFALAEAAGMVDSDVEDSLEQAQEDSDSDQ